MFWRWLCRRMSHEIGCRVEPRHLMVAGTSKIQKAHNGDYNPFLIRYFVLLMMVAYGQCDHFESVCQRHVRLSSFTLISCRCVCSVDYTVA